MRLVDRIRELCATAANAKDAVTAFKALQELREITRDRETLRGDIEAVISESSRQNRRRIS
jgi:hypothetical protein